MKIVNLIKKIAAIVSLSLLTNAVAHASDATQQVTVNNFTRAASDLYLQKYVAMVGTNTFFHMQRPTPVDQQKIVRMNMDTLYSVMVLDTDEPVSIQLPEADGRYISLHIINQDHYTAKVWEKPGDYHIDRTLLGTRYGLAIVRILVNGKDAVDIAHVNKIQQQLHVTGEQSKKIDVPAWEPSSAQNVQNALSALGEGLTSIKGMFGSKEQVDPIMHLIGTAIGFGGLPEQNTMYEIHYPDDEFNNQRYAITVKDVPVNAFWSITVYNKDGFIDKNELNSYVVNGNNAVKNADGSVTVNFGNCNTDRLNCLPIAKGWNYAVRLYKPQQTLKSGAWHFPQLVQQKSDENE